jgi:hypothetical protein
MKQNILILKLNDENKAMILKRLLLINQLIYVLLILVEHLMNVNQLEFLKEIDPLLEK